jgi:formylglycine-generating enzyme required for sulfatase activity
MQHTIKTSIIAFALVAITSLNLQAGTLEPTNEPAPSMHTLEEIYNQLIENRSLLLSLGGRLSSTDSMAFIPAGEFVMGNPFDRDGTSTLAPSTKYISAFYMDKYEVTKALWDEVSDWAATNGYSFGSEGPGVDTNHPVHSVD